MGHAPLINTFPPPRILTQPSTFHPPAFHSHPTFHRPLFEFLTMEPIEEVGRIEEPIPLDHISVNQFYWIRIVFPALINDPTPISTQDSDIQVFNV